jgi:hypothetical protein
MLVLAATVRAEPAPAPTRFEKDILAFEAMDKKDPPPKNAVVFAGDSTFTRWKSIHGDLPEFTLINRGFGGSQMSDLLYYTDRIVLAYKPRLIVVQEGGNDINAGKSPGQVLADIKAFVQQVRLSLPEVPIVLSGLVANTARWKDVDKRKQANQLMKDYVASQKNLIFIDMFDAFLGPNGKPREELFAEDHMHPSAEGYKLRVQFLRPILSQAQPTVRDH